ncbi:alpha/beta hydrolase [Candidatus Chloroploca mongolica]|uniref:alpha/beta hydrolase n=1 Tax=Candidatus Chloroploca mongolica TaxID=2528176 RepID=UPI001C20EEFB|nr:alpha/beta hydrolase-fold protein [Candidatus Chloroploca mongolica]
MVDVNIDHRVRLVRLKSQVLGVVRSLYVYLPPEYASEPRRRFPTLYLLRGHEREWVNATEDASRGSSTAVDIYERLRAEERIGPMILVMPGMASDDNAVPGMLTDFHSPERARSVPGVGTGRFQRFFFEELLPTVDRRFRTLPSARSIVGFSLGGYMAVKAAALHPERFVSVGAFDGSFPYASDGGKTARSADGLFAQPMFAPVFGAPPDLAHLTSNNPICLLLRADRAALQRLTWVIQYGPQTLEPWGSNFYRGEYLVRVLRSLGIANASASPVLEGGDHTWHSADRYLAATLPLHWHAMI